MKTWWFSILLLVVYVLTFQLWLAFPSRDAYLLVGSVAVAALVVTMRQATSRGYFVNRSDQVLHGLVIVDMALETASYELFHSASMCLFCQPGDPNSFHSNYNFCWCSAIFGVLVGGYHAWALHVASRGGTGLPAANSSPSEVPASAESAS